MAKIFCRNHKKKQLNVRRQICSCTSILVNVIHRNTKFTLTYDQFLRQFYLLHFWIWIRRKGEAEKKLLQSNILLHILYLIETVASYIGSFTHSLSFQIFTLKFCARMKNWKWNDACGIFYHFSIHYAVEQNLKP